MHAKATYKDSDERSGKHSKGKIEAADEGEVKGGGEGKARVIEIVAQKDTIRLKFVSILKVQTSDSSLRKRRPRLKS